MIKKYLLMAVLFSAIASYAQTQTVTVAGMVKTFTGVIPITIQEIQSIAGSDFPCRDLSYYHNTTVTLKGRMTMSGRTLYPATTIRGIAFAQVLTTTSVGNAGREIYIRDENGGLFSALMIRPAGATFPNDVLDANEGDLISVTGVVGNFAGQTQLDRISYFERIELAAQSDSKGRNPILLPSVGILNDLNLKNILSTGEAYEADFVELRNLQVVRLEEFSAGRWNIFLADKDGNRIALSERLKAGTSPFRSGPEGVGGSLEIPPIGATYEYVKGIIYHAKRLPTNTDGTDCANDGGGSATFISAGYQIMPFHPSHLKLGTAPPIISDIKASSLVANQNQPFIITANIQSLDATVNVKYAKLYYSVGDTLNYKMLDMVKSAGTVSYSATIPNDGFEEGKIIYYFIQTGDDRPIGLTNFGPNVFLAGAGKLSIPGYGPVSIPGTINITLTPLDILLSPNDLTVSGYNPNTIAGFVRTVSGTVLGVSRIFAQVTSSFDVTTIDGFIRTLAGSNNFVYAQVQTILGLGRGFDIPAVAVVRAGGLQIYDVQFTNYTNGSSMYVGKTVTLTGIVTATQKDLGNVVIQQKDKNEWGGLFLDFSAILSGVKYGDEITVIGDVQERASSVGGRQSSFTMLTSIRSNSSNANIPIISANNVIAPIVVDPNLFSGFYDFAKHEKFEAMLVEVKNPLDAGKIFVVDTNADHTANFGEYRIGNNPVSSALLSLTGSDRNISITGLRVMAGRNTSINVINSYNVSLITKPKGASGSNVNNITVNGIGVVYVSTTVSMEKVRGIMQHSFANMKLLPRNNADFINPSVVIPLNPTVTGLSKSLDFKFEIHPNPNDGLFSIHLPSGDNFAFEVFDIIGTSVLKGTAQGSSNVNLQGKVSGMYFIKVTNMSNGVSSGKRLIIQ